MSDILAALSIILGIQIAFLDKIGNRLEKFISNGKPTPLEIVKQTEIKREFRSLFGLATIPVFLFNLVLVYVQIPKLLTIFSESQIDFINFDVANSLFVLIFISTLVTLIITVIFNIRLLERNYHLKIEEKK
jgi:hypothetical protein